MNYLYLTTDNYVTLTGLQDTYDDGYINDATVVMTLYDENDAGVASALTLAMYYVESSSGNYYGTLPNTLTLTEYAHYELRITASRSALKLTTEKEYMAIYHPSP